MMISKLLYFLERKNFLSDLRKNKKSIISNNIKIGKYISYIISKSSFIEIGNNVSIRNNFNLVTGNNAVLEIADGVFINNNCSINCLEKIIIGENTLLGEGVKIYDHNHQYSNEKIEHQKFNTSPIIIEKNCWIGSNVVILKGVNIGSNSIIGAGCVIHKNIPENSIIINHQNLETKQYK